MRANKSSLATIGALAIATTVGVTSSADAHLRPLKGTLTTNAVPCDTLCTEGPLTGDLAGKLEFTMDTMVETGIPNVVRYTGVNTITTASGTLVGNDVGYWNLATGEFIDYTEFSSGTGAYEGKRGNFTIVGRYDPVTSEGASNYVAFLWR